MGHTGDVQGLDLSENSKFLVLDDIFPLQLSVSS